MIGSAWGDEGKSKMISWLLRYADINLRFQGGANAGHTAYDDSGRVYDYHAIPTGVGMPEYIDTKMFLTATGALFDLEAIAMEWDKISGNSGEPLPANYLIADMATLLVDSQRILDGAHDAIKKNKVGTTKRGIGTTYSDRALRIALTSSDFKKPDEVLEQKIRDFVKFKNREIDFLGGRQYVNVEEYPSHLINIAKELRIKERIVDAPIYLNRCLDLLGSNILLEGAQAPMLDLILGTYPNVTSSSTTAGGACTGTGISPRILDEVLMTVKSYFTRVGEGPFLSAAIPFSELEKEWKRNDKKPLKATEEQIRIVKEGDLSDIIKYMEAFEMYIIESAGEYGVSTARPRAVGALDLNVLIRSKWINRPDGMLLTRLDNLDEVAKIPVCTHYVHKQTGETLTYFPSDPEVLNDYKPHFEFLNGWKCSTKGIKEFDQLPENAKKYIRYIEDRVGLKFDMIGNGPKKDDLIILRNPWKTAA